MSLHLETNELNDLARLRSMGEIPLTAAARQVVCSWRASEKEFETSRILWLIMAIAEV